MVWHVNMSKGLRYARVISCITNDVFDGSRVLVGVAVPSVVIWIMNGF